MAKKKSDDGATKTAKKADTGMGVSCGYCAVYHPDHPRDKKFVCSSCGRIEQGVNEGVNARV